MVSQEGFFNGCFAMLAGMLRARFEVDGDLFTLATRLGVVWSLLSNASDYATRLNDDDLWHTPALRVCVCSERFKHAPSCFEPMS